MTQDHAYCIPDTNIFMHYQFFTEIQWRQEIGAGQVTVVIADTVLTELAKHKRDGSRQRRAQRARKAESRLSEMLLGPNKQLTLRKGEELAYKRLDPSKGTLESHHLNHAEGDDRILGLALQIKDADPNARVVVYTGDGPMRFKADDLGIEVVVPSDKVTELEEPDVRDQENERLHRQIAQYESRVPKLSLLFNGIAATASPRIILPEYVPVDSQWLDEMLGREYTELSKPLNRHNQSDYGAMEALVQFEPGEVARYQAEIDIYKPLFRRYLIQMHEYKSIGERKFALVPILSNIESFVTADDIDINISVPNSVMIFEEEDEIGRPKPPRRPPAPRRLVDSFSKSWPMAPILPRDIHGDFMRPTLPTMVSRDFGPIVERGTTTTTVKYHVHRLKHGTDDSLNPMWLVFPPQFPEQEFRVEFQILCSNQPVHTTGTFVFRVEIKGTDAESASVP